MKLLSPQERAALRLWLPADRPGPMVGLHVLNTGQGAFYADCWPDAHALVINSGGNYAMHGSPQALNPEALHEFMAGFVEAGDEFLPLLEEAFPDLQVWERVILQAEESPGLPTPAGAEIRRLEAEDEYHLWGLSPSVAWITKSWGGPATCAASGTAWGAFVDGRLVSVAVSFFVGDRYEDLGVVTEPGFRGRGLSSACAGALLKDILQRGRLGSWSTSPDNLASLRVAEKIGFRWVRNDRLYAVGVSIPQAGE